MTPDQMAALVVAVSEGIEGALACLDANESLVGVEACLHTSRAALAALSTAVHSTLPDLEPALHRENTDDPETCGHNPPHLELPGQIMCCSCGASRVDYEWIVL